MDAHVVVSDLTRLEFASAVARLVREGSLPSSRGRDLLARLGGDWEDYVRVHVSDDVLSAGQALVGRHPLRTLDAVQLASALLVNRNSPTKVRFGTADRRLEEAAAAEGLPPLLPA
jgi:predicted nucleic acid-binding protein